MIDLSTTYLGLKLKNPLVASASPLSKKLDSAKKLEEAGISPDVVAAAGVDISSTNRSNSTII